MGQLNKELGTNTVQFHAAYPLPDLKCAAAGLCSLPFPGVINSTGGTPNQKAERHANQIAYYHWVSPDTARAQQAVSDTISFFQEQANHTGHQCVLGATERAPGTCSAGEDGTSLRAFQRPGLGARFSYPPQAD